MRKNVFVDQGSTPAKSRNKLGSRVEELGHGASSSEWTKGTRIVLVIWIGPCEHSVQVITIYLRLPADDPQSLGDTNGWAHVM